MRKTSQATSSASRALKRVIGRNATTGAYALEFTYGELASYAGESNGKFIFQCITHFPELQLYPLREIQRKLLYPNSLTVLIIIASLTYS